MKAFSYNVCLAAIALSCFVFFMSCGSFFPNRNISRKNQTAFFSNDTNNISNYIDINGYYRCDIDYYSWFCDKNLLIFNDNSFSFFKYRQQETPYTTRSRWLSPIEMMALEDSLSKSPEIDLSVNIQYDRYLFNESSNAQIEGGAYLFENDNLVMEHPVIFNDKQVLCRNYFKIVDRQTLKREVFQIVSDDTIIQMDTTAIFRFHPAHNIPDSRIVRDKKRKWMWKSKEDWKQYKVLRKEYGKSKILLGEHCSHKDHFIILLATSSIKAFHLFR